jgi:hypothetical protein
MSDQPQTTHRCVEGRAARVRCSCGWIGTSNDWNRHLLQEAENIGSGGLRIVEGIRVMGPIS